MPRYKKRIIEARTCDVCGEAIRRFQLISGVPIARKPDGTIEQVFGHYLCVRQHLGPAKVLRAMDYGLLPNIPEAELVDGKLKKFVEWEERAEKERLKVFEYLEN